MTLRTREFVTSVIKAYDVRGLVGKQLDGDFVRAVGASFGRLMRAEGARQIVVGHDMRDSSPELSGVFAEGVLTQGLDVVSIGLCSTDGLYFAAGSLDCPGAMFTASHNPAAYNGIKLCRAGAKPVGQETGLNTIVDDLIDGVPAYSGPAGLLSTRNMTELYADFLLELVDLSRCRPLVVAADAGNGMGGFTVPAVLGKVDALNIKPLYFELDGSFPNHEANPLDPANLVDLQRFVLDTKADIGLAFDGDADRCFVIDECGNAVSPSAVTALVAERELAKEPGATVIHNLITSRAVPEIITDNGGVPARTRVGHSFIKQQMAETGAIFGGEHSAHYYFRDFWGADSGMLAAMHVLAALGEQREALSTMMKRYEKYAASGEINSTVHDQTAATEAVLAEFSADIASEDRLDGVTVELTDGSWFNLRASNTEPLLRLNVESATKETTQDIVARVLAVIRKHGPDGTDSGNA